MSLLKKSFILNKKKGKDNLSLTSKYTSIILVLLIIGVGGYYYKSTLLSFNKRNNLFNTSQTNNQELFPPSVISNLEFEYSKENKPGSSSVIKITDTNGTIIKTIKVVQTDNIYDSIGNNGYSRGIVTSDEIYPTSGPVTITKWAILKYDGSILPISSVLTAPLKNFSDPYRTSFITPHNFLLTLIRPNPNDYSPFHYSEFDGLTGSEKKLLTIYPLNSQYYPYFMPEEMNYAGDTVSFLVSDVIINSQAVQGTGIVVYNLLTNTLTIKKLPSILSKWAQTKQGDNEGQVESVGVSSDGNLLVYQSSELGVGRYIWTTHIYNLSLQKDIIVPTKLTLPGGYDNYFFSPDNGYLIFYVANAMDIVRTSDGKIVQSFNLGGEEPNSYPHYNDIEPVGWIDTQTLVYNSQTTDNPGTFDLNYATSHAVNVITHQIQNYSQDLGSVRAIMYK